MEEQNMNRQKGSDPQLPDEEVADMNSPVYNDDNIRTLTGLEHIRLRPGMYILKAGNQIVKFVKQ